MRKRYIFLSPLIILMLTAFSFSAYAQAATGPSDAITAPPTSATAVGKVLCAGQPISISGPQDASGVDYPAYQWYKIDAAGNKQLTTTTGRTYTETPTTAGYYDYAVVTQTAGGCTSPISDVFKVFVLPPLTAAITGTSTSVCVGVGLSPLTATATPATGYVLNYQWTRNGVNIAGATSNTYTVTGETTPGTVTFGVNISYALNASCTATATDDITITPLPTKPAITAN